LLKILFWNAARLFQKSLIEVEGEMWFDRLKLRRLIVKQWKIEVDNVWLCTVVCFPRQCGRFPY
ncbi:MAG TPA: hypothetical protein VFQ43_06700, partial [Nitrososphaera sp.]|nr:hypothetical protein [Nitrososphaera sp.]